MPTPLCAAELLVLQGADASAFAHAQFCSDVNSLALGDWQWSAWLDAQGRVRNFFALLRAEPSTLFAWLPLGGADTMRAELARYVMRAAVKLETRSWMLHTLEAAELTQMPKPHQVIVHAEGVALMQPGTPDRVAWLAPTTDAFPDTEALHRWRLADIENGLPLLAPELAGEFVAQALDLERVGAIAFNKGCYPGQEIVARLHFRGGNKYRPHRLRIHAAQAPQGTAIVDDTGRSIGRILYGVTTAANESVALAVLSRLQALESGCSTATGETVEELIK